MEVKQQDSKTQIDDVSPLVRDKTYGERMYDTVFNKGINFWVNLLTSAAFSLWAASSRTKIKLPGMHEAATPSVVQTKLIDRVENSFIIKSMKNAMPETKRQRAVAVSEVFTLLLPGHLIMIPSVWLGAKIKPAFVRWFDKRHYGDNAEADPSIKYRHELVDAEARPTLLGATVGRLGTMATTMTVSRLIGSENSAINKVKGMEKFPGLNQVAYRTGSIVGEGLEQEVQSINRLNTRLSKRFDWSEKQIERGLNQGTYNRALPDYIGFTAMDTLYTLVTASVIHPIMWGLRKIPGMTYTTRPPVEKKFTNETGDVTKVQVPRNRMAAVPQAEVAPTAPAPEDKPTINVSEISHVDRVHNTQQEVSAG